MKRQFAIVSLLSTVLFLAACSTTSSRDHSTTQSTANWQTCAAVGGAVWGIPAALGSLATGGAAAIAGALVAGIGCATADQPENVLFDFGAYNLDMKDRLIIDKIIQDMGSDGRIKVVGYTCDIGTPSINQTLSDNRANAVREYLISRGIEEDLILTEGMGERNPVAPNDSEEHRTMNRRVEMVITRF